MSGFFWITSHGVPQDLINRVMAAPRQFHRMPRSSKMRWWSSFPIHHPGYVPLEEPVLCGSGRPPGLSGRVARMTGPNIWLDLPGWKDTVAGNSLKPAVLPTLDNGGGQRQRPLLPPR